MIDKFFARRTPNTPERNDKLGQYEAVIAFIEDLDKNPDLSWKKAKKSALDMGVSWDRTTTLILKEIHRAYSKKRRITRAVLRHTMSVVSKNLDQTPSSSWRGIEIQQDDEEENQDQILREAGRVLFRYLTNKDPQQPVSLIPNNSVIILTLEEPDFLSIAKRTESSAGVYKEKHAFKPHPRQLGMAISLLRVGSVPLVLIKKQHASISTIDHETSHSTNHTIRTGLAQVSSRENYWSSSKEIPASLATTVSKIKQLLSQPPSEKSRQLLTKLTEDFFAQSVPTALGMAKDEIIADFSAVYSFVHARNLSVGLNTVNYNYFRHLGLPISDLVAYGLSSVVQKSFEQYNTRLKSNVAHMEEIWNTIRFFDSGFARFRKKILGFLILNPLEDWELNSFQITQSSEYLLMLSKYRQLQPLIQKGLNIIGQIHTIRMSMASLTNNEQELSDTLGGAEGIVRDCFSTLGLDGHISLLMASNHQVELSVSQVQAASDTLATIESKVDAMAKEVLQRHKEEAAAAELAATVAYQQEREAVVNHPVTKYLEQNPHSVTESFNQLQHLYSKVAFAVINRVTKLLEEQLNLQNSSANDRTHRQEVRKLLQSFSSFSYEWTLTSQDLVGDTFKEQTTTFLTQAARLLGLDESALLHLSESIDVFSFKRNLLEVKEQLDYFSTLSKKLTTGRITDRKDMSAHLKNIGQLFSQLSPDDQKVVNYPIEFLDGLSNTISSISEQLTTALKDVETQLDSICDAQSQ